MTTPELLDSTGDPGCDRIVQGVVGVYELAFPDRIRGCYLRGSRASGSSIAGSDLDLFVLFKNHFVDGEEWERARALSGHCARIAPVLLEIVLGGERGVFAPEGLSAALDLKLGTRLLYGEDIRPQLPGFDAEGYTRSVVHTPYFSYRFAEQRPDALVYPLAHIDPDGPFFGFDQWQVPGPDGVDLPSTKLLVATVGWTATAIVALRAGVYVRDKAACVELYREHVGDEWTELVDQVHELCRNQWRYLLPPDDAGRRTLRALCDRALKFQNHFLRLYRDYQVGELESGDPVRQRIAVRRLGQLVFPDLAETLATYEDPDR
jgi:hypothetical protein